jgi:hypothetical protein
MATRLFSAFLINGKESRSLDCALRLMIDKANRNAELGMTASEWFDSGVSDPSSAEILRFSRRSSY